MNCRYAFAGVILTAACALSARAVEPASEQKSRLLSSLLQQEADGQLVDRKQLLTDDAQPSSDTLGWHAGKIKCDGVWRTPDELTHNAIGAEYLLRRQELAADPQKHLKLAR